MMKTLLESWKSYIIKEQEDPYRKDLIATLKSNGAKVYTYDNLPAQSKAAADEYLDNPKEATYLVGELPTKYVAKRIVEEYGEPFKWPSFEDYHKWYVGEKNIPNYPLSQRWPSMLAGRGGEGFIWDGWHRFHSYYRSGSPTVPVYMLLNDNEI